MKTIKSVLFFLVVVLFASCGELFNTPDSPDNKNTLGSIYGLVCDSETLDEIAGATGNTILKCLDLSIRESFSPCAETLWAKIGHAELDAIIENDFGIVDSDISSLVSNPKDILAILKIFYTHDEIKEDSLIAQMKDSFLVQPTTTYNWRQGLPSGFTRANVYNKVGWDFNATGNYWNIYHDAAIVEFPESNRHYIVVVMSNRLAFQHIRRLGTIIEKHFYGEQ